MSSPYYAGSETGRPPQPVTIGSVVRDESPDNYIADEKLAAAVNVALILGKPLLLTGEPGTGKTKLADHLAMALGLSEPERFDTKSTSQATDLFYRFDSLARFHSAHAQERDKRALDFVAFGPLGLAILRTLEPSHPLFEALALPYPAHPTRPDLPSPQYPVRSVVLIDEIDKAPRDFPNDLLDSIDNLRFSIRELERDVTARLLRTTGTTEITANKALQPIVVITSNSEKNLPDPFLRRCVYFHIQFPNTEQLLAIVARRAGDDITPLAKIEAVELARRQRLKPDETQPLLRSAVDLFESLRGAGLRKRPSTAELIDWLRYLRASGVLPTQALAEVPQLVLQSLGTLVKSIDDLNVANELASKTFPPVPS